MFKTWMTLFRALLHHMTELEKHLPCVPFHQVPPGRTKRIVNKSVTKWLLFKFILSTCLCLRLVHQNSTITFRQPERKKRVFQGYVLYRCCQLTDGIINTTWLIHCVMRGSEIELWGHQRPTFWAPLVWLTGEQRDMDKLIGEDVGR